MAEAQQVWLTHEAHGRLKEELTTLLAQRSEQLATGSGVDQERDPFDDHSLTERRDREKRIRKLQEMLQHAVVGEEPPDDGVAEPGMILTVRYTDGGDTETFLLADSEQQGVLDDIEICSPRSPLGRAVSGAKQGEQRQYRRPDGRIMTVSVIRAVPYGHQIHQG